MALSTKSTRGYFHAAPVVGVLAFCVLQASQATKLLSAVPAPQAALELSLPLKQHEAGLKHLSLWGKILARNGKVCPPLLPSLPAPSGRGPTCRQDKLNVSHGRMASPTAPKCDTGPRRTT